MCRTSLGSGTLWGYLFVGSRLAALAVSLLLCYSAGRHPAEMSGSLCVCYLLTWKKPARLHAAWPVCSEALSLSAACWHANTAMPCFRSECSVPQDGAAWHQNWGMATDPLCPSMQVCCCLKARQALVLHPSRLDFCALMLPLVRVGSSTVSVLGFSNALPGFHVLSLQA